MTKSIIEQIEDVIAPALTSQWKDAFQLGQQKIATAVGEILDSLPKDEPLEPDPRFPDRPTHPDMTRLSSAIVEQDAVADMLGMGEALKVDAASLLYLGRQRLAAVGFIGMPEMLTQRLLSLYLDAFQLGVGFTERGGARHPEETGTAGEGSSS